MRIIIIQIVKFFRNCFSLEFDCKKPGRTKSKTPTINMTESNLSIKTPKIFVLVRSERLELSWTRSTRPSTVPVYQFQHNRNMSHNKLMTMMFQIDKFYHGIYTRS